MTRVPARRVLLIDAIGCGLAALLTGLVAPVWRLFGLPARWRLPFAGTLGAFASFLGIVASRHPVRPAHLRIAALGNIGWVAWCLTALGVAGSRRGRGLLLATTLMDGTMAALQWIFASRQQR